MKYYYYVAKIDENTGAEILSCSENSGYYDDIYVFETESDCLEKIKELEEENRYPNYKLQARPIYY